MNTTSNITQELTQISDVTLSANEIISITQLMITYYELGYHITEMGYENFIALADKITKAAEKYVRGKSDKGGIELDEALYNDLLVCKIRVGSLRELTLMEVEDSMSCIDPN